MALDSYEIPAGYEAISEEEQQIPLSEVVKKLAEYGYIDCTEEANRRNGPNYAARWVFNDPNGHGVHYCDTEDDVRELWYIVEFA